jgi:hypothetical protein
LKCPTAPSFVEAPDNDGCGHRPIRGIDADPSLGSDSETAELSQTG